MILIFFSSCEGKKSMPNLLLAEDFNITIDGKQVSLYTLKNKQGTTMQVTNFGARVVSLWTIDKNENWADIVLGFENIDRYINTPSGRYFGAVIGRCTNRIAEGKFTLNGVEYALSTSNNGQCHHGGDKGYNLVVWDVSSFTSSEIVFNYVSKDGEEGFPGNLNIKMIYSLTDDNEFKITYEAITDKDTPVNLTHHSFFNLYGEGSASINSHELCIVADKYCPVDEFSVPLGVLDSVSESPFDFRKPMAVGARIEQSHKQLTLCRGYDHNYVLNKKSKNGLEFAASVYEPSNGRYMEVWTTEPGIQFFSGNFFDGKTLGKSGHPYNFRSALALETQHFPDSPNQPNFPSVILKPNEVYNHTCIYKFDVK